MLTRLQLFIFLKFIAPFCKNFNDGFVVFLNLILLRCYLNPLKNLIECFCEFIFGLSPTQSNQILDHSEKKENIFIFILISPCFVSHNYFERTVRLTGLMSRIFAYLSYSVLNYLRSCLYFIVDTSEIHNFFLCYYSQYIIFICWSYQLRVLSFKFFYLLNIFFRNFQYRFYCLERFIFFMFYEAFIQFALLAIMVQSVLDQHQTK